MNAVVAEYQKFIKSKFQDINLEAANLITNARRDLEVEITDLENKYSEFRINSPLLAKGSNGSDIYTARYEELAAEHSNLEQKIDEASGRLKLVKESLLDFAKSGAHNLQKLSLIDERNAERLGILVTVERGKAETAAFQSMQPERMAGATAEYSNLLTLKTQLKQLSMDFAPEHPEIRALTQQIQEMEEFLKRRSKALLVTDGDSSLTPDDVMNAYVSMLEHDLRALQQRSKDIETQMSRAEEDARNLLHSLWKMKALFENELVVKTCIRSDRAATKH